MPAAIACAPRGCQRALIQRRDYLAVLVLRGGALIEFARVALGAQIIGSLEPVAHRAWRFRLSDGRAAELTVK
jgi:hypothetical protein